MRITRNEHTGETTISSGRYQYYAPVSLKDFNKLEYLINVKGWKTGKCWQFLKKHYDKKIERWEDYEKHRFQVRRQ